MFLRKIIAEFVEIAERNLRNFMILSYRMCQYRQFFKGSITNYFLSVTNEVIFKIKFLKLTLCNFYLIRFFRVINSTHFDDSLHLNLL